MSIPAKIPSHAVLMIFTSSPSLLATSVIMSTSNPIGVVPSSAKFSKGGYPTSHPTLKTPSLISFTLLRSYALSLAAASVLAALEEASETAAVLSVLPFAAVSPVFFPQPARTPRLRAATPKIEITRVNLFIFSS